MAKLIRPLTDAVCRNTKATDPATGKPAVRKVYDGQGLYLQCNPTGSKLWRLKYQSPEGKERTLALGAFPEVSLTDAREKRVEARKMLAQQQDPVRQRKLDRMTAATRAANTYELVARELHERNPLDWQEAHREKWLAMQANHLFPKIGRLPVADITAPVLLAPLMAIDKLGRHETATSLRQYAGQVLRYAVQTGRAERDISGDLRGAIRTPIQRNYAAVTSVDELPGLLRAIHSYSGTAITREALWLSALLFQRPGNLRALRWTWVDLDAQTITIPSLEMKRSLRAKVQGKPHIVPLSSQAVECLQRLEHLTGSGVYVFPSARTGERPMSDGTVNAALQRLGYKDQMTAHGFRAMARTVLAEHHDIPEAVLEELLGHGKPGPLGSAYDRATWDKQRKAAMTVWGNYLEGLTKPKPRAKLQKVVRIGAAT